MTSLINIVIFVLGGFGFWVARYIHKHKVTQKPLVCMVGFDCHTVIHSDYSKFLGVPVEIFGMIYYTVVAVFYLLLSLFPHFSSIVSSCFIVAVSLAAFLFSLYLMAVQAFVLRKGCSWCIVSSLICLCIFILTAVNYDLSFIARFFLG